MFNGFSRCIILCNIGLDPRLKFIHVNRTIWPYHKWLPVCNCLYVELLCLVSIDGMWYIRECYGVTYSD